MEYSRARGRIRERKASAFYQKRPRIGLKRGRAHLGGGGAKRKFLKEGTIGDRRAESSRKRRNILKGRLKVGGTEEIAAPHPAPTYPRGIALRKSRS